MTWPNRGRRREYYVNIALGIDQGIGTWFGIDADESISSYVGRTAMGSRRQKVIDWIFNKLNGEENHCFNNIEPAFKEATE